MDISQMLIAEDHEVGSTKEQIQLVVRAGLEVKFPGLRITSPVALTARPHCLLL